jgi:hypothetical protein
VSGMETEKRSLMNMSSQLNSSVIGLVKSFTLNLRPCLVLKKYIFFSDFSSHRILRHMYKYK